MQLDKTLQNTTLNMTPPSSAEARPKWHLIYYILAGFDIIAISFSLYLNHQITEIHTNSIEVNKTWSQRMKHFSQLNEIAEQVNAPGNLVFLSRNADIEKKKFETALKSYNNLKVQLLKEFNTINEPALKTTLIEEMSHIDLAMDDMVDYARLIFTQFKQRNIRQAGAKMAAMDNKFYLLQSHFRDGNRTLRDAQESLLESQKTKALEVRQQEVLIAAFIIFMVLAVTWYGRELAKRIRANIKEKEVYYRKLLDAEKSTLAIVQSTNDGLITIDSNWMIRTFNHASENLFAYTEKEVIGKDLREMIITTQYDMPFTQAKTADKLDETEVRCKQKNSTLFPGSIHISPMPQSDEILYTVTISDLSTFKSMEKLLIESKESAESANKIKSDFLANMSHELRTPLNSIIGFAAVMLKGIDGPINDDQEASLININTAGKHLLEIVSDILDISKIETGTMNLEYSNVDLTNILEYVCESARVNAQKKNIEIKQSYQINNLLINADELRIKQILTNLISNAVKFTEKGNIEVLCEKVDLQNNKIPDKLFQQLNQNREYLLFTVRDSGIGIPKEKMLEIFDEFQQVDNSSARHFGGAGLGLPLTKHLVEMHGGQIWFDSKIGEGTSFYFMLPKVADKAEMESNSKFSRLH